MPDCLRRAVREGNSRSGPIRYFYDDAGQEDPFDENANITPVPGPLIKELGFFLVPASRTWDRMISFGSELFRRVVAYVGGKPAEAVLEERERLRRPQAPLEADEKLAALVGKVDADIAAIFGRPSKLKLRVTTTDSEGVLEAVVPHFADGDNIPLPSRRQGNGLISLQTLILLMRFGHLRIEKGESFLMAIEEPELHVPPPLQRRLLHLMQSLATQTIITSHSPTVAAVPAPHELILIVNDGGRLQAKALLSAPMAANARNPERGLFLADRDATVSAVMHPFVLVPEGKTDASWLRLLSRIADLFAPERGADDAPPFTHEVGIIPTKDARIAEVFGHLTKVHPGVVCLVDGDAAGQRYTADLCGLAEAPATIIRWPQDWRIEDVICWIVAADPAVLADLELAGSGIPNDHALLIDVLLGPLKTNEIAHALLLDAISRSGRCLVRVEHVLRFLGAVAAGRVVPPEWGAGEDQPNAVTKVWTFNNAVPGI
jgi:putative ATP-dependent endonuclease of the OLD family